MKLPGLLLWILVPALVAAWLLFGSGMEPEAQAPEVSANVPRYSLRGVTMTRLDAQGRRQFTAVADSADYFDDESAKFQKLKLSVYNLSEKPWHLTSPTATTPAHQRLLSLDGPVDGDAYWPDGEAVSFHTPQLWVDPDKHQLKTDAGVTFDSVSRNGTAKGLRGDWRQQTMQLLGDVKLIYAIKPKNRSNER